MTISWKKLLAVILLFSSSFAWFFIFYYYFDILIPGTSVDPFWHNLGVVLFLFSIVISAMIGSAIAPKFNRRKFLLIWIVTGIITTLCILFLRTEELFPIIGILNGISFGFGFPSCQAFLADSTIPEERGRVAGLAVFVSFVLVVLFLLFGSSLKLDWIGLLFMFIIIKSIGFLSFLIDPIDIIKSKGKPWMSILRSRDFNYYIIAYILFCIAAGLVSLLWIAVPETPDYEYANNLANYIRYIGLGLFALLSGLLADRIGRKKPVIIGLIMLGVAYALIGLLTTSTTYFINLLLSGFAWGIIMVVYLVIPADLSSPGIRERYYAIGWVFPIALYTGINGSARLLGYVPKIDVFSAILSFILFASILPILYAGETLSESKIRERKYRDYTEKVGKMVQKTKKEE